MASKIFLIYKRAKISSLNPLCTDHLQSTFLLTSHAPQDTQHNDGFGLQFFILSWFWFLRCAKTKKLSVAAAFFSCHYWGLQPAENNYKNATDDKGELFFGAFA